MKKIFCLILMLLSVGAFAQWSTNGNYVYLTYPNKVVSIGKYNGLEKLSIKSTSNITPLGLYGHTTQTYPFINLFNSSNVSLWKLYATSGWWSIGTNDSTTALLSGKQALGWLRVNGVLYADGYMWSRFSSNDTNYYGGLKLSQNNSSITFGESLYPGGQHGYIYSSTWQTGNGKIAILNQYNQNQISVQPDFSKASFTFYGTSAVCQDSTYTLGDDVYALGKVYSKVYSLPTSYPADTMSKVVGFIRMGEDVYWGNGTKYKKLN